MPVLIQFSEALKSYGKQPILDDASVQFSTSDKMGLIGCNGSGKSTLCKLILGEEELDGGRLKRSSALRLGYLKQEDSFGPDETVLQFLERDSGCESWQCGKTAGRFDLKNEILEAKVVDLPGGYQTRVKLAAMLLGEPNFLVLDEPTNYLDLKTLILLELFLADFNGGFLVVSHDREFLKRTCASTLEIESGELTLFPGGIEPFLAFKAERQVEKQRRNRNVDARRKQMEDFIARNKVRASTASRAQSKMKQLDKLQKIEVEHRIRTARIKIPEIDVRRGLALRCEGLAIGYGESEVASSIRFEIQRGEKVAVLGDNGEGKTTFLRTIAGELARLEGEYSWGHGLEVAYYAQHVYSALNPGLDIYTHLDQAAAPGVERQEILRVAGSFLFSGEEVEKKISVLSGGERARVCLAGLLLGRRPVLLLDEPTNHLDFETVEALAQAGREPGEVDAVLVACSNLQRAYPAVAVEVQNALGAGGWAYDMNVACSSATFGLQAAVDAVRTGSARCAVVVSPENDSNMASMMVRFGSSASRKGSEPKAPSTVQNSTVIRKPSRLRSSLRALRLGQYSSAPVATVMTMAMTKLLQTPSA